MTWSTNGFNRLDVFGTLNTCSSSAPPPKPPLSPAYMREHLLHQAPTFLPFPSAIKHADPSTPLQAVTRHLELVHGVDILNVTLDAGSVRRAGEPEVEVFVASRFEVEGVCARVKVGQLVQ